MKDYTIYVTEEIAKKALEKGFECFQAFNITSLNHTFAVNSEQWYYLPTAEQICGWLREEKGIEVEISRAQRFSQFYFSIVVEKDEASYIKYMSLNDDRWWSEYKDAVNAGINEALDLIK